MKDRIESHIKKLLREECLPDTTMEQATRFLRVGDLRVLMDLPLSPDAMIQVGNVLQNPNSDGQAAASLGTAPTLTEAVRDQLRTLVDDGGEHAEAALFVLSKDLRARALNYIRAKNE